MTTSTYEINPSTEDGIVLLLVLIHLKRKIYKVAFVYIPYLRQKSISMHIYFTHLRSFSLALLLCLFFYSSCTDDPVSAATPRIEFLRVSKDTVDQQEVFSITFFFEDGDSDVTFRNSQGECTMPNIVVTDARPGQNDFEIEFCMPDLPESGQSVEGEVTLDIASCCVLEDIDPCTPAFGGAVDTLLYEIRMFDRAMNLSNTIEVTPIIITCN